METPVFKLEHSDARGEIFSITLPGEQELMLLHSKKGSLRGGHSHDVDEIVVVLTGAMQYSKKTNKTRRPGVIGGYWEEHLRGGDSSRNGVGVYHLAEFLEDSWVLEWKINTHKGGWQNIDDEEWREKVKANAANSTANV